MPMRLGDLAEQIMGRIVGDAETVIYSAAPFEFADAGSITVAALPKFTKELSEGECRAAAVIVPEGYEGVTRQNLIYAASPMAAFADAIRLLTPPKVYYQGVHPTAVVDDSARLGTNVSVGPHVTIGANVSIGANAKIMAGVFIGDNVNIGDDVLLHPNVSILSSCRLGDRVIVNAGAVIGSDGFGFAPDNQGVFHKILHLGIVRIGSDVEVGANTTIDRATFGATVIADGVKLDNMVQVAHNVEVGENTVIAAQTGIAGSTTIGRNVMFGGQVGISGHINIADRVMIGAASTVGQSIEEAGFVGMSGLNVMPHRQWLRYQRIARQLPELKAKLDSLERTIATIKGTSEDDRS